MKKKINRVIAVALGIMMILGLLNWSTVQSGYAANAADEPQTEWRFLSDMDWESATHGDAYKHKTVQKNKPFTKGNEGFPNKISLQMENGEVQIFEKGLGTIADIAAHPSVITYDISNQKAKRFYSYIGIDRTAGHPDEHHAKVEKIEVLVDDEIKYTSGEITYDTAAILVEFEIPAGASKLKLKAYAGEKTWADEVVYADAKIEVEVSSNQDDTPIVPEEGWTYLSDIDWVSATHGDAYKHKEVQKNQPFTKGNEGFSDKISLKMPGGKIRVFEKGLGTIADISAHPSVITYDLRGAAATRLQSYIGIDRTAGHPDLNHANVEKIEFLVDGVVKHSSQNILYETEAIFVDFEIPANAKKLEIKAFAGAQTWADEVVYADIKVKATGKFMTPEDDGFGEFEEQGNAWEPQPKRMEVSNEHPLLMLPLYAHGPRYEKSPREYSFWGDDTMIGKWQSVPEELKEYTVIQLHPDDLPKRNGSLADFYEHYLEEAQNYINPKTSQNEPIPLILTVYTAGNRREYTASHWLTTDWIERMYQKYSCLKGIFSTESYWVWQGDTVTKAKEYLELSAKHGGYFIWAEQNPGASIEKSMGTNHLADFRKSLEKYSDYFIFMFKNTPQSEGHDAPSISYMKGLWLAGYTGQWGGLMDTWKWYETGKWKLFAEGNIQKHQPNRQWPMEPEAMLGMEAMMIYLNGGCVYNFEHPFYTYGVKDKPSPLYLNVIQEFFRYAVENPAPSKEEVLAMTKAFLRINYSEKRNGHFYTGLNTDSHATSNYTTGRYSVIPAVPNGISRSKLNQALKDSDIEILEQDAVQLSTLAQRKSYFNDKYPQEYQGDIFAQKLDNRWFVYNYKYNENVNQVAESLLIPNTAAQSDKLWDAKVTLEPHTFVILQGAKDKVSVKLNNYRVDKDELWEGATNAYAAINLRKVQKQEAVEWIDSEYIQNTKDAVKRISKLELRNVEKKPVIKNLRGLAGGYEEPVLEYDELTKTATVTVSSNGYIYFDILTEESTVTPEPEPQPQPEPDNSVLLPYVPEVASSDSDTTVINEEEIALSAPQEGKFKELTVGMEDKADVDAIRKWLSQKASNKELLNTLSDKALQSFASDVHVRFADEKADHWYAKELSAIRILDLVKGYEDGTFGGGREITGKEYLTLLVRAAGLPVTPKVGEDWFEPYREAAQRAGWLQGLALDLDKSITREEVAELSYRFLTKQNPEQKAAETGNIKDEETISKNYRQAVHFLYANDIFKGYEDGSFRAQNTIKRREVVTVLYRLLKK